MIKFYNFEKAEPLKIRVKHVFYRNKENTMNNINYTISRKTIFALGLLLLFFMFYLFPTYQAKINEAAGTELQLLDVHFSYTKNDVLLIFQTATEAGRAKIQFITGIIDMIYPLVYTALLFLLLKKLTSRFNNKTVKAICFLPIIGMASDYIENLYILNMLNRFPSITDTQVLISSYATSLKWTSLSISILFIIILAGLQSFQKLKKQ